MENFKVGDRVEVIESPCTNDFARRFVGSKGIIVDQPKLPILITIAVLATKGTPHEAYFVALDGGEAAVSPFCRSQLRKLQPPKKKDESFDWRKFFDLTGWLPAPMRPVAA